MNFLINKLKERESFIEKTASVNDKANLLSDLHNTFLAMSNVGVNDERDYRDFFYILAHVPTIAKEILNRKVDNVELAKISHVVYMNRDNFPINTICNFYKAVGEAIGPIKKMAYPQEYGLNYIPKQHDLSKWVQTMRQIYALKSRGMGGLEAFNQVTEKWDAMEKRDFKNWLNFYESKSHLSYKTAAADDTIYYEVGGVPLPMGSRPRPVEEVPEEKPQTEDLSNVVKQLLGRIASAEKIYTDPGKSIIFRKLLGAEYEAWLTTLHQLKRKIQTLEFKNASTIVDVIERFGNQLRSQGMVKTASLLVKVAQPAPPAPPPVGGEPPAEPPAEPIGGESGPPLDMLGGPPSEPMAGSDDDTSDPDAAMEEFLENIGAKSNDAKEEEEKKEMYAADDDEDDASIVVSEEDYDIRKVAQEAPIDAPRPPAPIRSPAPPKAPPAPSPEPQGDDKDALDHALKHITIKDVIRELEEISVLYKNRPLSMRLTKVDLMMQSLGISPYFPNMAEAMKSSLDSNQYVLTRIDDVLAKLRGAYAAGSGQLEELQDKLDKSEETMAQKRQQKATMEMEAPPEDPVPEGPGEPKPAPPPAPLKEAPELKKPVEVTPPQPGVRI